MEILKGIGMTIGYIYGIVVIFVAFVCIWGLILEITKRKLWGIIWLIVFLIFGFLFRVVAGAE